MREGGVDTIHVTIAYHENFRETVHNLARKNRWSKDHSNPSEDDIGLAEIRDNLISNTCFPSDMLHRKLAFWEHLNLIGGRISSRPALLMGQVQALAPQMMIATKSSDLLRIYMNVGTAQQRCAFQGGMP